jgi:hypothetical protein
MIYIIRNESYYGQCTDRDEEVNEIPVLKESKWKLRDNVRLINK